MKIKTLIRESHRRQFAGEDYQSVANDLTESNKIDYDSYEYQYLQSAPDPDCDCGFCKTADWLD